MVLQARDGEGGGLRGTSGGGDDVGGRGARLAEVAGGVVLETLGSGVGVDGGHHRLLNSEIVFQNFHDWGNTVGSAGSVGEDAVICGDDFFVDAEHDGFDAATLGRGGEDDFAGAGGEVFLGVGELAEGAGAFHHGINLEFAPGKLSRVGFTEEEDSVSVHDDVFIVVADLVVINAIGGIVFE